MFATKLRLPAWLSISSSGANRGPAKAAWKDLGKNWRGGSWMEGHGTRSRFRRPDVTLSRKNLLANDTFFIKRLDDQELLQTGNFRGEILGVKSQDFVAIFPHKVYGMLRKFGFRRRSVLIQWRAQGVIQVSV